MEKLATTIIFILALSTIGVGLIYMATHDASWTYKWGEVFKDSLRIMISIYIPLTIPKWRILRDLCYTFAGWYMVDLIYEIQHFGINEQYLPVVSDVGTFITWTLYFAGGVLFTIFTYTDQWKRITKRF